MNLKEEALARIETKQAELIKDYPECAAVIADAMTRLRTVLARTSDDVNAIAAALAEKLLVSSDIDLEISRAINRARLEIWSETMALLATPRYLSSLPRETMNGESGEGGNGDAAENRRKRIEQAFEDSITLQQYIWLASQMGESQLIDILVAAHIIRADDRQYAIRVIGSYLGESATPEPNGGGIWKILGVGNLLRDATVKQVLDHHVRRAGYRLLLEQGADDMKKYKRVRRTAGQSVRKMLEEFAKNAGVKVDASLEAYLNEVEMFFMGAANINLPPTMVDRLPQEGNMCPVPSWRQSMALMELSGSRHGYLGFEPGYGKSLVAFAQHEFQKQRNQEEGKQTRTLFIGPKMVINELPNRLRPGTTESETAQMSYYKNPELDAPTVGHIHAGMTEEEIDEAIEQEVVFCPYSMLAVKLASGMQVSEKLRRAGGGAQHWTQIVFDEAHSLQGDSTWTGMADDLIHRHPNVYDEGNILLMSGTPAIGHLKGLAVQLALLQPQVRRSNIGTGALRERGDYKLMSAVELRMALLQWIIRYDIPEQWMEFVDPCLYDLSREELDFLRLIGNDQTLAATEKLGKMLLFIRCPELVSGGSVQESTLFDWVKTKLEEDLAEKDTVLIAEHMRSDSVLREMKDADEESEEDYYFYTRVQSFLNEWKAKEDGREYVLHVIHGTTKSKDRERAYADARRAKKDQNFKCVILANSACLNMGIDLRSIQRIISLEWPWNSPELMQLLKRSQRAGNEDIRLHVFIARSSVEEGIVAWAQGKLTDAERAINGELSEREESFEMRQEETKEEDNAVKKHLSSPEQQLLNENFYLHNKGPQAVKDYWDGNSDLYKERLKNACKGPESNKHRALSAYVHTLESRNIIPKGASYLHTNSQGFALHQLLKQIDPARTGSCTCMEPTQKMIDAAIRHLPTDYFPQKRLVGTPDELIALQSNHAASGGPPLQSGLQDVVILDGLDQMHFKRSDDGSMHRHTRVNALIGAVRATKMGGRIIIPLPREACTEREFHTFGSIVEYFGLQLDTSWTDVIKSSDNEGDAPFELFVTTAIKVSEIDQELVSAADQDGFSWTHHHRLDGAAKAERTRRENLRLKRKLPFDLVHGSFKCGNKNLHPVSTDDTIRMQQLDHLEHLQENVRYIRSLAKPERWMNKGSSAFVMSVREQLEERGIQFLPHLISGKRPVFRLAEYPHHLVFPYDSQWDE